MSRVAPCANVKFWSNVLSEQSTAILKSGLVNPAGGFVTVFRTRNVPVGEQLPVSLTVAVRVQLLLVASVAVRV